MHVVKLLRAFEKFALTISHSSLVVAGPMVDWIIGKMEELGSIEGGIDEDVITEEFIILIDEDNTNVEFDSCDDVYIMVLLIDKFVGWTVVFLLTAVEFHTDDVVGKLDDEILVEYNNDGEAQTLSVIITIEHEDITSAEIVDSGSTAMLLLMLILLLKVLNGSRDDETISDLVLLLKVLNGRDDETISGVALLLRVLNGRDETMSDEI